MNKINYEDKDDNGASPSNLWTDDNANEVKDKFNEMVDFLNLFGFTLISFTAEIPDNARNTIVVTFSEQVVGSSFEGFSLSGVSQNVLSVSGTGNQRTLTVDSNFSTASEPTLLYNSLLGDYRGDQLFVKSQSVVITNNIGVDLPATVINLSNNEIEEGNNLNDIIGIVSDDASPTGAFSLPSGILDNDSFLIVGNQLLSGEIFLFDVKNTYQIRVRSTNPGGVYEQDFTINITELTTNWLLASGVWDDTGVWDDSAVWSD